MQTARPESEKGIGCGVAVGWLAEGGWLGGGWG